MGFDVASCMVKESKQDPVSLSNVTLEEIVREMKTRFKDKCYFIEDAYNQEMYIREHQSVIVFYSTIEGSE